jgi:hypothetical protein
MDSLVVTVEGADQVIDVLANISEQSGDGSATGCVTNK